MKISSNVIFQIVGTALQVLNYASGMIPAKYQWLVAGVVGILQGISGIVSHYSNPDGTPAALPYTAPK